MRVLLDECIPRRLKEALPGHDVHTVADMGWRGRKNGELLSVASAYFDVFITVDRSIEYQQNLLAFAIAVLLLHARSNDLDDLAPLMPRVCELLPGLRPGQLIHVEGEGG
jgi:predicted nuclease of predicted toxin-antitoxin system